MTELFGDIGFTGADLGLMLFCSFFSAVGGLVHILVRSDDVSNWPPDPELPEFTPPASGYLDSFKGFFLRFLCNGFRHAPHFLSRRPTWIVARLVLSMITGLLVALFFVGTAPVPPIAHYSAKILILSIIAGYLAPSLWMIKERMILDFLESTAFKNLLVEQITSAVKESSVSAACEQSPNKPQSNSDNSDISNGKSS